MSQLVAAIEEMCEPGSRLIYLAAAYWLLDDKLAHSINKIYWGPLSTH